MASINDMKSAVQGVAGLQQKIAGSLRKLLEDIYSEDPQPDPRKHGSLVISFFQKRYQGANTVLNQARYVDGTLDPSSIARMGSMVEGFASNVIDTLAQDPATVSGWESLDEAGAAATAAGIVAALPEDTFNGTVELIFNGSVCAIQLGEMQFADEAGLWNHPFGRFA